MKQGTIARLTDRGFGFIELPGRDDLLFFHHSSLLGITFEELEVGAPVMFEVDEGVEYESKPKAIKVRRV